MNDIKTGAALALAVAATGMLASGVAQAGFYIDYPAAVQAEEAGLMSNRTHYEQRGKAAFRMSDAERKPALSELDAAGAEMVVDLAYRTVTHMGDANSEKRVRAFADNVPLDSALTMVVPKGWQVYKDKDLPISRMKELVSYEGNLLWTDVLAGIGEKFAYQFHVDWRNSTVVVKQGKSVSTAKPGKVKIIHEPPAGQPVQRGFWARLKSGFKDDAAASTTPSAATSYGAGDTGTSVAASASTPATGAAAGAGSTLSGTADSLSRGAGATGAASGLESGQVSKAGSTRTGTQPPATSKAGVTIRIEQGTLYSNLVRLSEENGWKPPYWKIDGDYRVPTYYTLHAPTFEEAVYKFLDIHPVEADINRTQRMIYVHKEAL